MIIFEKGIKMSKLNKGDKVQIRDLRDGYLAAQNATVVDGPNNEDRYLICESDGLSYWVSSRCVEPQGQPKR